jgi:methionyl-tRNA synthetase
MNSIESVNEFINNKEPWVLAKQDNQDQPNSDLHEICSAALQSFRVISIYLSPVLPVLTAKISAFFDEEFTDFDQINNTVKKIKQYEHMLKRIERESIDQMIELNTVKD